MMESAVAKTVAAFGELPRADEVQLWLAWCDLPAGGIDEVRHQVSNDDWVRSARMPEVSRSRFLAGRATLRMVLASYLGIAEPADFELIDVPGEKPSIEHPTLRFSFSESSGLAAIAVADGWDVGVDVQAIRQVGSWGPLSDRLFGPDATRELATLPEPDRWKDFSRRWARAEAVMKLWGTGLTAVSGDSLQQGLRGLWIHEFTPARGWAGALASSTQPRSIMTRGHDGFVVPQMIF